MGEIKEFLNSIVEKLYPTDITCHFCGDEIRDGENFLCDRCEAELVWNTQYCLHCGSPVHSLAEYCIMCKNKKKSFDIARAPLIYKDKVANAIQNLKYNGKKYLSKSLARFMYKTYKEIEKEFGKPDCLVAVPLYKDRQKKRGYNQAELLAKELSTLIGIEVISDNLIRIKNTETQTNLSYKKRQENLDDAFVVQNKPIFKGKTIMLIDDVLTTGSTADHCSRILKKAGVKRVFVLTVATTDSDKG